jgi:hypothetical protein
MPGVKTDPERVMEKKEAPFLAEAPDLIQARVPDPLNLRKKIKG